MAAPTRPQATGAFRPRSARAPPTGEPDQPPSELRPKAHRITRWSETSLPACAREDACILTDLDQRRSGQACPNATQTCRDRTAFAAPVIRRPGNARPPPKPGPSGHLRSRIHPTYSRSKAAPPCPASTSTRFNHRRRSFDAPAAWPYPAHRKSRPFPSLRLPDRPPVFQDRSPPAP
jgi:hypothetical protein